MTLLRREHVVEAKGVRRNSKLEEKKRWCLRKASRQRRADEESEGRRRQSYCLSFGSEPLAGMCIGASRLTLTKPDILGRKVHV
jgi:hypothetical protein